MAKCTAKAKSTGKRCTRPAIEGGAVCRYHGGAAPQVQKKARERLAALVDPAIGALGDLVRQRRDRKTRLGAARDILDRNDLTGKTKVEHSGSIETTGGAAFAFSPETLRRMKADMDAAGVDEVEVETK